MVAPGSHPTPGFSHIIGVATEKHAGFRVLIEEQRQVKQNKEPIKFGQVTGFIPIAAP